MTKFYVDNWITALRGSVVRRVFGTHERIVVFGSEHGEYSNTINFRFIEYISESSRPYNYHLNMNMQNGKPLELLNFYEARFKVRWSW